jgi:hypothetical protein
MYLLVEDFKGGLDTRRMFLTSKAGTLQKCKNAHITRGGEIEKRLAFANYANLPSGTFGLQSAGGSLFVFGSAAQPASFPANLNYQRLQHPSGQTMTELLFSETFNGKIYAIAQYADGSVHHFFNGVRVTTWDTVSTSVGDNSAVAAALAAQIDSEAPFIAISSGPVITITAVNNNQPFTTSGTATNGGSNNDQAITFAVTQTASPETKATGTFRVAASATTGVVASVSVNGVNLLPVSVTGLASTDGLATALAVAINAGTSGYTATVTGSTVTVTAPSGTGVIANGYNISSVVTGTGVTLDTFTAFSGGVSAKPQITTATIGGTFELNDVFTVTLSIPSAFYSNTFRLSSSASGVGTTARTFANKLYSTTRSLLYFSEIGDPTKFGGTTNGAGFINLSNQDSGFEDLQAVGIYQGKMAIFSRRAVQIWTMDADPTKNVSSQTLKNIGTFAPRSVTNFGDIDVFFLSDSGVRSLRARDASNAAAVSDVGTNIDTLISADLLSLPETTRNAAFGIIEPKDGRYWLAVGPKVYVYSFFPSAGIAAWSTYEPGFTITHFSYANSRIYARSGDTVYLYGGVTGNEYDNSQVEVVLPYLDAGKPAHTKTLQGIDLTCEGMWDVFVGCDTTVPEARDLVATVNQSTFDLARLQAAGMGTHIGVRIVTNPTYSGAAKIGNFASHFEINDAG